MNENLKKDNKILYGASILGILLMVICYFGVNSFNKGTYSAFSCPTGYSFNGTNCSNSVSGVYSVDMTGKSMPCTYGGSGTWSSCSLQNVENDDGEIVKSYKCTGTCYVSYTETVDPACYIANHRYLWSSTNPGGDYVKTSVSQSSCSGCESGYVEDNEGNCVANASACYIANHRYLWSNTYPGSGYTKVSGVSQSSCSGCESGYVEDNEGDCVVSSSSSGYPSCSSVVTEEYCGKGSFKSTSASAYSCTKGGITYTYTRGSSLGKCSEYEAGSTYTYDYYQYSQSTSEENPSGGNPSGGNQSGGNPSGGNQSGGDSTGGDSTGGNPSGGSTTGGGTNITENPKTSTIAILIVWIIGIGALIYSFVYFRQETKDKK